MVSLAERLVCSSANALTYILESPNADSAWLRSLEADALCAVRTFFLRASVSSLAIVQVVGGLQLMR